jgi:hypothetical protein
MKSWKNFLKRRWFELRQGHSVYLSFLLSAVNFILIVYRLLIEQVPFLKYLFPHLYVFAIVFLIVYVPITILIGRWHIYRQLKTDLYLHVRQNPYIMEILERVKKIEKDLEALRRE